MAKHRQLMERWRKWKIKKRRTQPKAFSSKAMGGLNKGAMQDAGANAYGHRARSFMGIDPVHLLSMLFNFPDNPTIRGSDDPYLLKEVRLAQMKFLDPSFRVLEFNRVYLEGNSQSEVSLSFFLGGLEMFFVSRRVNIIKRSIIYTDHDRAMRLYREDRITWLPPIVIPSLPVGVPSPNG